MTDTTTRSARITLRDSHQVRIVSDFEASLAYYRDALGCAVDGWGHAERGALRIILQQARDPRDVRPNAVAAKRDSYPSDWEGPDDSWDTFVDVAYDEVEALVEELRGNGARIVHGPIHAVHDNGMRFVNVFVEDLDGYRIVFGGGTAA